MEHESKVVSIIPKPVNCKLTSECFSLNNETTINYSPLFRSIASYLQSFLSTPTGFPLSIQEIDSRHLFENAIILNQDNEIGKYSEESYTLQVASKSVILKASHSKGIFYAVQTLRQLLPVEIESYTEEKNISWSIPGIKIFDYPRFIWRGFMFDEGRHFHGKAVVKRMLDLMALNKLNVFHWHLTEDQGWRIEVKSFPRLTKIGAWRKASQVGGYRSFIRKKRTPISHGGYYSQEDIKEIIDYATLRNITVVPEIDLPGHTLSVLAAYPKLSCTGGPFEVATDWGIFKDVLCPGKEQVFSFIEEILKELVPLFPGSFFHIGGDEVLKDRWKTCPDCQQRIKDNNLTSVESLQEYFTTRVIDLLKKMNKIPIGWNEILPVQFKDLNKEVIGQHWLRGDKLVLDHLKQGRKFIISRFFYTYLDYPYTMTPLKKTYFFDPIPEELDKKFHKNIIGLEAPLWTEWIPTTPRIDWQTFPRLTALAEVAWSQQDKDYLDFRQRLKKFLLRLDKLGVKYAKESIVDPSRLKRLLNLPILFLRDPQKNISE